MNTENATPSGMCACGCHDIIARPKGCETCKEKHVPMHTKHVHPRVKRQSDTDALMETCRVFWAFSREQFAEGKIKIGLQEGEKLTDIGMGGFMPAKNLGIFTQGLEKISSEFKQVMKDEKARKAHIKYELMNHEADYTGDIESTMDALGDDFTREEVLKVFKGK